MNDHIPDVTKMINQWTNGTEILNVKPNGDFELGNGVDPLVALGQLAKAFMQQQDRIKRLEAVTNDPHALWTNWLRGDVKLPVGIGDVRQYQDRIKRLEEAGDALANTQTYDLLETVNWRKAKEAKP